MRLSLAAGLFLLGMSTPLACAQAMQFQPLSAAPDEMVIAGRGPIMPGDTERLTSALSALPQTGGAPPALALDSGGGNVTEAKRIAGGAAGRLPWPEQSQSGRLHPGLRYGAATARTRLRLFRLAVRVQRGDSLGPADDRMGW